MDHLVIYVSLLYPPSYLQKRNIVKIPDSKMAFAGKLHLIDKCESKDRQRLRTDLASRLVPSLVSPAGHSDADPCLTGGFLLSANEPTRMHWCAVTTCASILFL